MGHFIDLNRNEILRKSKATTMTDVLPHIHAKHFHWVPQTATKKGRGLYKTDTFFNKQTALTSGSVSTAFESSNCNRMEKIFRTQLALVIKIFSFKWKSHIFPE